MTEDKKPKCKKCGHDMITMYGCGWDYDRWICPACGCDFEIELETTTMPEEMNENSN